ncbi:MAG: Si-specific NAD(P)(+) transhydrogenase [bacterium]
MNENQYDLAVIGSGPAGQKGAIAAAKLGKKVAIVDRKEMIGGVSLNTGTIPSKTLREAILYFSGFRQRSFYGKDYSLKEKISVADLSFRVQMVLARELAVVRAQLQRNGVTTIYGTARFVDPHTITVETVDGPDVLHSDYALIACGTRPARSLDIPFDGKRVIDSDQLRLVQEIPREVIVVGAGIIGLEYASMLTALHIEVTIIDQRPTLLDFVDEEIISALCCHMRQQGATFRLGEKVVSVGEDEKKEYVEAVLESGKKVHGDILLYTVARQANTDLLNLEAVGIPVDARGRISVNAHYQTNLPHIYAAGDVIGFPSLAASSMEQGRLAGSHMFGVRTKTFPKLLPYGIYSIPEISMIGKSEQELTAAKIPYEVGVAKYEELAKAQMLGDETGLLKILFDPSSLKILGVHALGDRAAEIIHIGQAVMAFGGTLEYFRDTVFNYPTLAEAYKVAALNGLNKL